MVTLQVPDMHCKMCVARIQSAFDAAGIEAKIELENKTVTVAIEDKEKAISELDDLGFSAGE